MRRRRRSTPAASRYATAIGLAVLLAAFPVGAAMDSQFAYEADGDVHELSIHSSAFAVLLERASDEVAVGRRLAELPGVANRHIESQHVNRVFLVPTDGQLDDQELLRLIDAAQLLQGVERAWPILYGDGTRLIPRDEVIVAFSSEPTDSDMERIRTTYSVSNSRRIAGHDELLVFQFVNPREIDAFDLARSIESEPGVLFAQPNFLRLVPLSATPNDTYFTQQWALHNTGQTGGTPDADIDASEAWDMTVGTQDVTIAVIDVGVDLDHLDLAAKMVEGYDAVDDDEDPTPLAHDAHGTACAGIAAAITNNSRGIAGVGWAARIMPIRIGFTPEPGSTTLVTSDEWVATGILEAVDRGADVLSNSYSLGTPSDIIDFVIGYATNNGRNGLGCVLAFASGNENTGVSYPATLDDVIAVGATNDDDERCDEDDWGAGNGSNFGPELDIVAPGDAIYTTDITGTDGYSTTDYYDNYGGTSAATPHVAGVVALLLSSNPGLTSSEAQQLLEQGADDEVGDPSEDTEGWDHFMGWGRLNAQGALALTSPVITVEVVDSGLDVGTYSSLALDEQGRLAVTYYDEYHERLKFARKESGTWSAETVDEDGNVGEYGSLFIDSMGRTSVSYYDATWGALRYAGWVDQIHGGALEVVVDAPYGVDVGQHSSLTLDDQNRLAVVYYDSDNGDLRYALKDVTWQDELVEGEYDVGQYGSLFIDGLGRKSVSYYDATWGALRYAGWVGQVHGGIVEAVVETPYGGDVGQHSSLTLDDQNRLAVSYYDSGNGDVRYALKDGTWQDELVESEYDVGQYGSLFIDGLGRKSLSYYDATWGALRYAGWIDQVHGGALEIVAGTPSGGDVGQYSSLTLDDQSRLAVSYYDSDNGNLRYALKDGTWQDELVESEYDVGQYGSLFIDGLGRKSASYYDATWGALRYAGWVDQIHGGSLEVVAGTPAGGDLGQHSSLTLDDQNRLAVAYYDSDNGDVRYALKDGTWQDELVESEYDVGQYGSLFIDALGRSSMSYYDATWGALRYAGWVDQVHGASLEVVEGTPSGGDVGQYSSLTLDEQGSLAVAYYDVDNGDLKVATSGDPWLHDTADNSGNVGQYASLVVSQGGDYSISYYDATQTLLKYIVGHPFWDEVPEAAFYGVVSDAQSGSALEGAAVEVLLGGSVVASTATDEFGRYEIEPLAAGDYVLCAERTAYNSEVTDLQMYSLEPILLSMELDPLGAATLPDLVLTSQDITYTVLQSGAVEVTAMVENAGLAASDVAVRFLAEHVSEGYGEPVSMGTDQLIASLGQGQAEAATVTWTPLSGYDRYHVIVDPENQITESVEINNAAYRNLGEVGRVPPEILSVTAQWDGIESDLVIGQFMSGVLGQDNTFTAEVVDPDGDISHVEFQFGDQTPLTDSYATGGWTVELDVGEFPGDNILLEVIAYDEAGLASDPFVVTVDMREMPVWMNTYLKLSDTPLDWPVGFSVEGGYFHETFSFDAGTSAGDVFDYIVSLDDVIVLIGSTTSEMKGNVEVDIGIPLSPALPPTIRGVFRIEEKLMDQTLDAEEVTLVLELDPDWNLTGISTSWGRDFPLASWEIETTIPIPAFPAIHVLLAIGADFSAGLDLTLACTNNFESFSASFTPSVEAAIHGTVGLTDPFKFARIEGVISPTLVLDYTLTYVDPDEVHHTTSGVFRVDWTVRGCILWGLCHDFASGTMGPWDIWDEEFGEGMEIPLAEPSVPDLLAYPSLRAGPAGELGMVWIADADPDPLHVDPEVQFTYEDTLGEWSAPIPVTGGGTTDGWFQTSPVIAWGPGGEAVSVWVQNSFTESQALSRSPTFSEALDHQDLWWSRWDGVSWSAPASLHADTPGGEKADGVPSLDISPVGDQGLCVWARSVGDSALLDGISEVFYSIYSGDAWGTAERLTDNTQDDVGPDVSFGSDGKALGVWLREVENLHGHNQVLSSLWDGVTWSEPDFLGGNGEVNHDPTVTHLPNGDGVASWVARQIDPEDSTAVYTVYAARWDQTSGVWNDPETVHSDSLFMESTIVRSDARNIACITWRGHDGYDGDLFASMKDMDDPQSTWTLPHQLTDDDYTDWMVAGDVDDQNNLRFVDLKTDLADVTGNPNRGEFFDGMSLVSRGIGADLTFGDDLNFGFHPISADLKVSAMAVSDTLPSEGQTVTVTALVENIGDVLSSGTTVSFWSAHPDSGGAQIGSAVALAEVYPDSSAEVQTDWVAGTGTHELWAWVDPDGLVDEQTESNNRGSVSVDIFPDLVATEVYAVSDNPEPGDWVTVFGVVENVGGTAATDVLVRFLAGGDTLAAAQIPMLLPAKAETLTSIWQAAEGANELLISVDSDSLIPEWIDDNNQMSGLLKVLPDLMLSAETLDVSEHSDTHLVVTATLSNTGGVVADSVTVRFYDGDPLAGGTLKADTMVVSLDAFSEVELERQIAFDAGVLRLYVVADGDGEIEERDENNNRSYGRFVFTEVPDLSITPEDIHVVDYSGPGLPFWIEAHVTNLGGADVTAVRVHFYDGHPDTAGVYLGGRIIPTVPQDSTRVALFEWAVADLEHVLYVHVDGDSLIEELDEANNLAGVSLEQAVHVPEDPVSYLTALHPSVPNPFGASTELHYSLSHPCEVSLKVFDVAGRLVAVLEDGWREAGHHHRKWDGRNLNGQEVASGVYFSRLQAAGNTLESKIVVVR